MCRERRHVQTKKRNPKCRTAMMVAASGEDTIGLEQQTEPRFYCIFDENGTILSIDNNMVPSVLKSNTGRQTNSFEMQYGWTDISNDY